MWSRIVGTSTEKGSNIINLRVFVSHSDASTRPEITLVSTRLADSTVSPFHPGVGLH